MSNCGLTRYEQGKYCTAIKLFINIPHRIRSLNYNINAFKKALNDYPLSQSYCAEELTFIENDEIL
jgi:hypothetical protein